MVKNLLFWGGKYKAAIIYDMIKKNNILLKKSNLRVKFIFDPNLKSPKFNTNAKFSNNKKDLEEFIKKSHYFITCIGNELGMARYLISRELEKKGLRPLSIVSKDAKIYSSFVGIGVQLFPNSIIQNNAKVGNFSILNTGSILEHDTEIGNGVHLMPGCVIGGNAIIKDYVTIGMNATILPGVVVEQGSYIGAGAVVTKNVEKNNVVTGNPARYLKKAKHNFDLKFFK
jgi:acetyltransferase EpsM